MDMNTFDHYLDQLIETRNLTISADARSQWWDAVKSIEGPVFGEAIRRTIADDEEYPSPARVRGTCRSIMRERLSRVVQPTPPSGLSQTEYTSWEREWKRQIVRGEDPDRARKLALDARHTSTQQVGSQAGNGGAIEGTIIGF